MAKLAVELQAAYDDYVAHGDMDPIFRALWPLMEGTATQQINRFPNRGFDRDDIVQEMAIRILRAVPRYEPERGATLATWLQPHISRAVLDLDRRVNHTRALRSREKRGAPVIEFVPLDHVADETVQPWDWDRSPVGDDFTT